MRAKSLPILGFAALGITALAVAQVPSVLAQRADVQRQAPASREAVQMSFAPIVKKAAPAVVNVYVSGKPVQQAQRQQLPIDDPVFRRFFGEMFGMPQERMQSSLGSGVIVSADGLVVTNTHVVKIGGQAEIRVVLADKREFEAKLLIADERTDLAVLKIEVGDEELPSLDLGDSDNLEVGDIVLAIGNPFGVGQTVTSGIVSALARTQVGVSDYQFFIQTDAAINPGNSGGALVNMAGELIGINTAIYSRSGGSIGIGFAIPANMVKTVVRSAEQGSEVQRPWTGAELQDVTADIANSLGFARPEGALIVSLHPDSPLAAAGMGRGDVILAIDGKPVENAREFSYRVATAEIGSSAMVEYQHEGKRRESRVQLIAAPETTARDERLLEGNTPFAGLTVANLSPGLTEQLGLPPATAGVIAAEIKGGPARRIFRRGDLILKVNGTAIDTVETLVTAIEAAQGFWDFSIKRRGRVLRLQLGG